MTKHKLRPETEKAFDEKFPGEFISWEDGIARIETKAVTVEALKQFIATIESEAEERGRSEAIRKAKLVCLGSVTSLGYGLKWKGYEVQLLINSLNDGLDLISEGKYENTR